MENVSLILKIGDVVVLKSGGPDMTVTAHERDYLYHCTWVSDNGTFSGLFDARCLQRVVVKRNRGA